MTWTTQVVLIQIIRDLISQQLVNHAQQDVIVDWLLQEDFCARAQGPLTMYAKVSAGHNDDWATLGSVNATALGKVIHSTRI